MTELKYPVVLIQDTLGAEDLNTAFRPAAYPAGSLLYLRDAGVVYLRTAPLGVAAWTLIGGPDAMSGGYWVNVAGQLPVTPYTSVQAAVTAAADDGHNASNPAEVFILPGIYTESVTMLPGINLQGFDPVTIIGTVTVSLAASATCFLQNLTIGGNLVCAGALIQALVLRDVSVQSTSGNALLWTNTNASSSLVLLGSSSLLTVDALANALHATTALGITTSNGFISAGFGNTAMFLGGGGTHRFVGTEFTGTVSLDTTTNNLFQGCRLATTGAAVPAVLFANAAAATVREGVVSSEHATTVYAGTGSVTFQGTVAHPGTGGARRAATVTTATEFSPSLRQTAATAIASPFPVGADVLLVTPGAPLIITLPILSSVIENTVISVKSTAAVNVVTVTPNAADQIDTGGGGIGRALAADHGTITLLAKPSLNEWFILSII